MEQIYFVQKNVLRAKVDEVKKKCMICQLYQAKPPNQAISSLPQPIAPKDSWSIDIITDLPMTEDGFKYVLLAVDNFSSFVVTIPMKTMTSKEIITSLRQNIFSIMGFPTSIRSDEQASMYNSKEFFDFLERHNIIYYPTAVAAPFSNARAESQIKNIKYTARKFFYQENLLQTWNEYLPIITLAHNATVNTYGYTPFEIMHGIKAPHPNELLHLRPTLVAPEDYLNIMLPKIEEMRKQYSRNMKNKTEENMTYKNKDRILKTFQEGDLVLHRQSQVSTGNSTKWGPDFLGPYKIMKIHDDNLTASIKHLQNGRVIKAHFLNLQPYIFDQNLMKPREDFMNDLHEKIRTISQKIDHKTSSKKKKIIRRDSL
jgi:hypothetical protein